MFTFKINRQNNGIQKEFFSENKIDLNYIFGVYYQYPQPSEMFICYNEDVKEINMALFVPRLGKNKIESIIQPTPNPEIMGTPEVLFVSHFFGDNEIQWFAHEFAYHA